MEGRKLLNIPCNVVLGLCWIFFPLGIVVLCVEKANLKYEDKGQIICCFVLEAVAYVIGILSAILAIIWAPLAFIGLLAIVPGVFAIISMIFCFCKKYYECPIAYDIACGFIKTPKDNE